MLNAGTLTEVNGCISTGKEVRRIDAVAGVVRVSACTRRGGVR
jgi:hypothetical protein